MAKGVRFTLTATDKTKQAFTGVQGNIRKTQGLQRSWNAGLNSNRRAVQQFGFQMTDFAVQVAGGQSAMLAFTQQGGQMLQFFGPAGAIAAAFLAVFGSMAIAFTRSGAALSDLTPILGVLSDDFRAIGRGLVQVKEIAIDFANVILNNMDRILITTATVAGFFAGRWVVAFAAARISTFTLVGALTALRVALIRTGIGALIIGAGELVYQFTRLTKAAGGFGNAMSLLLDVAKDIWNNMGLFATAAGMKMTAAMLNMTASVIEGFLKITQNVSDLSNKIIGSFVGAYKAVVAVWNNLPAALARIGGLAVNGLISAMDTGIQGITSAVNSLLTVGGRFPDLALEAPSLDSWKVTVGEATNIAGEAASAFADAFNTDYVGPGGPIDRTAEGLRANADLLSDIGGIINQQAVSQSPAVQRLIDLMGSLNDEGSNIDIRDWFGGGGDDASGGGGGGGGDTPADKMSEQAKRIKAAFEDMTSTVKNGLKSMWAATLDDTKNWANAARNALSSIMDKVAEMITDPIWEALAQKIAGSLVGTPSATGLAGGFFSNLLSFDGGGNTPNGSRTGGLDGKGGFMAMVHPNETIIDNTRTGGSASTGGQNGTLTIMLGDGLKAEMAAQMEGVAIQTVDSKSQGIVSQAVDQSGQAARTTKRYIGI